MTYDDDVPCPLCEYDGDCPQCNAPYYCEVCHEPIESGDATRTQLMDLDPGNPEVGPQPNIQTCTVHDRCAR